jgi:Spy/CpxP family protein refolding chaperone
MKKTIVITGIVLLIVASLGSTIYAQPRMGRTMGWAGNNAMGLTAEQSAEIQKIRTKGQSEMLPVRLKLQTAQTELQQLIADPNHSSSSIDAKIDEIADHQKNMQRFMVQHQTDIRNVLTDAQKTLVKTLGITNGFGACTCIYGLGSSNMMGRRQGRGMNRGGSMGRGSCGLGMGRMWR